MLPVVNELLLPGAIFALLCIGSIQDYKEQIVSNWTTYSIILLSIPLIALNSPNITWFHFLMIALLFVLFSLDKFGGADFKALTPIILSLSLMPFIAFMIIVVLVGGILMHPIFKLRAFKKEQDKPIEVRLKLFPAIAITYFIIAIL